MIHKEGYLSLAVVATISLLLTILTGIFWGNLYQITLFLSIVIFLIVLQFFRNPNRSVALIDDRKILAPADGKIVVIEQVEETEYFHQQRKKVSIFMSPFNVHVNRIPFSGHIKYYKYHPGQYLVAWHPKSSTDNERTTTVIAGKYGEALIRQVAGALARRIVHYTPQGLDVVQGEEMGFIKFGSRVDLYLPLNAKILVSLDQKVVGNRTIIAEF